MIPFSKTTLIRLLLGAALFLGVFVAAQAGTATSISGLYTTGSGTGTRDSHWLTSTSASSYVVSSNFPTGSWVANTSSARWISYSSNAQGNSSNAGPFTYTLTFTITGTGSGTVGNVAITLALAADDSATISVNGTSTGVTASGWASTSTVTLDATNSNFVIGQNTITITVSNSGYGATGLLVSSISGVVPEVGAWIPVAGAVGLIAVLRLRRKRYRLPAAV